MRKTYLSLAQSRAMAAEYPVGDPTGGAAYGKREMPVVAVAVAVWEVAAVAEVGFAAMTAFEAVSAVSAVVGAVGAVTGNKDLAKIGAIGSVVGGIGSFAANQGWIANESLGVNAEGATTTYAAGEQTAFQKALGINVPTETGAPTPDVSQNVTKGLNVDVVNPEGNSTLTSTVAGSTGAAASGAVASGAAAPAVTGATDALKTTADVVDAAKTVAGGGPPPSESGGLFDSFKAFAKANPTVAYAGMTTVGQTLGGLFDPTKEAQKQELEARAMAERQAAATSAIGASAQAQQTANLAAPLAAATTAGTRAPVYGTNPVTGKPLTNVDYTRSGLINTVTGRV